MAKAAGIDTFELDDLEYANLVGENWNFLAEELLHVYEEESSYSRTVWFKDSRREARLEIRESLLEEMVDENDAGLLESVKGYLEELIGERQEVKIDGNNVEDYVTAAEILDDLEIKKEEDFYRIDYFP